MLTSVGKPFKDGFGWNRCDKCGRFIALSDFESGKAVRLLEYPDSEVSRESYITLCHEDSH